MCTYALVLGTTYLIALASLDSVHNKNIRLMNNHTLHSFVLSLSDLPYFYIFFLPSFTLKITKYFNSQWYLRNLNFTVRNCVQQTYRKSKLGCPAHILKLAKATFSSSTGLNCSVLLNTALIFGELLLSPLSSD